MDLAGYPDLYEASISELSNGLIAGRFTSVDLVRAYLARIDEVNIRGPALRAIIETNPHALEQAAALDAERSVQGSRGPLHGIPILLKDNIATDASDGLQTTAGSYTLLGAIPSHAAHIAEALKNAGALILGKTNLSEWANFRGTQPNGWSGRGGQCTSPYIPLGDPSGSSSGSAVSAAIGLAAACIGTETDGSIISPSERNNIFGVKPTVGLTSRYGDPWVLVIPIATTQDTVGPMTRCVEDSAILLSFLAGPDERDEPTLAQPLPVPDYVAALHKEALRGARLGVPRKLIRRDSKLDCVLDDFERALDSMRELGAVIVEGAELPSSDQIGQGNSLDHEVLVMETEFKAGVEAYLSAIPEVPTGVRTITDIIDFNIAHADKELIPPHYDSQTRIIPSKDLIMNDEYRAAVAKGYELGRTQGIDAALLKDSLDALVLPSAASGVKPAAIAGYPVVTVPLGFRPDDSETGKANPIIKTGPGQPYGLAFIGTAWSEAKLLSFAYAFEQATQIRLKRRAFELAIPKTQLEDVVKKT
ncbi:amidase signature enzyme [Peniophora sp. CONT]|nr:amidase signature enzyme [Peniophora sp. CONT]